MIEVSVLCTAYNQEQYIRKTLEGFVMQETSFDYEVIVHDDASTDDTQKIIMEYAEKYPDIIKPVLQSVNQFRQNISIDEEYLLPAAKGRYLAFCEGDDYWSSPYKLQKQYDSLVENPECAISIHKVRIIRENGEETEFTYPSKQLSTGVHSNDTFFEIISNDFLQLTSYFFPAELKKRYYEEAQFRKKCTRGVGDIPFLFWIGSLGKEWYYIDEELTRYRSLSKGSFNEYEKKNDKFIKEHHESMIQMIRQFDIETDYKYHNYCIDYENMEAFSSCKKRYALMEILTSEENRKRFMGFPLRKKLGFLYRTFKKKVSN